MKAVLDALAFLAQQVWRVSRAALRYVIVLVLTIGTGVATVTLPAVFDLFSTAVSSVALQFAPDTKRPVTVRDRVAAERKVDGIMRDAETRFHQSENRRLSQRLGAQQDEIAALRRQSSALRNPRTVRYRQRVLTEQEAVLDTVNRVRARAGRAVARNIASMPGEAIPGYGAFIIAGATAWEVSDLCALMGELYELEVAVNPAMAVPPDRTEACGAKVPTAAEIWNAIKRSPGAVWAEMRQLYAGLPDFGARFYSGFVQPILNYFSPVDVK